MLGQTSRRASAPQTGCSGDRPPGKTRPPHKGGGAPQQHPGAGQDEHEPQVHGVAAVAERSVGDESGQFVERVHVGLDDLKGSVCSQVEDNPHEEGY